MTEAQIFIAALGASSYTFAEASLAQDLPSWIRSHVHAFEFFGGVPEILVPDNLKSGVNHPCRYEPDINPTYQDLADHYGTTVIPARVRKLRDKAKAESAVFVAERWILAALRTLTNNPHRPTKTSGAINITTKGETHAYPTDHRKTLLHET